MKRASSSVGALLWLGLLLVACGSDDHETPRAGSGAAGRGSQTGNVLGGSGAIVVAGAGSLTELIDMAAELATPMCNADAVSAAECGGAACPTLPATASATCTINCCSPEGGCGQRSSDTRIEQLIGTACVATAVADTRCPSTALAGLTIAGCCDAQGICGQLVAGVCVSLGGQACDAVHTDAGL